VHDHASGFLTAISRPELRAAIHEILSKSHSHGLEHASGLANAQSAVALAASFATTPDQTAVIEFARRLIETGDSVNYARAAEIAGLVKATPLRIWQRAPLLVLLAGWFVAGIAIAPFSVELWAGGFLALVGLQFVLTVRGRRVIAEDPPPPAADN
jgi:hypothetical protein